MGRDTFDAVLASVPNGATAGRVTARGAHYEPNVNFGDYMHWGAPPACVAMPRAAKDFVDLTGRKFGRFTVVGYLGKLNPKKKALWLVRCVCGDYEARHAPTINCANPDQKCRTCRHWVGAARRYETQGPRPIEDFTSNQHQRKITSGDSPNGRAELPIMMHRDRDTVDMFNRHSERGRFGDNESVCGNDSVCSNLCDLSLVLHHETPPRGVNPGAILVSNDGDDTHAQWIPKSRCEFEKHNGQFVDGKRKDGSRTKYQACTVTLPESLAKEKGLI